MINFDVSLLIQIVNFLFLIWVMNLIVYKPIRKILTQRKEKIGGLEKNIDDFTRDADEKDTAFSDGLKSARLKGKQEKDALMQEAVAEEKRIVEQINDRAQKELASVREKVAKDAEAVRASLMKEIDAYANAIGQKILGRTI